MQALTSAKNVLDLVNENKEAREVQLTQQHKLQEAEEVMIHQNFDYLDDDATETGMRRTPFLRLDVLKQLNLG